MFGAADVDCGVSIGPGDGLAVTGETPGETVGTTATDDPLGLGLAATDGSSRGPTTTTATTTTAAARRAASAAGTDSRPAATASARARGSVGGRRSKSSTVSAPLRRAGRRAS